MYYPGCLTKFVLKQEAENYKKILIAMGIDWIMLPNEFCCGSPVFNAGYESEGIKLAKNNLKLFKEHNIGKIITNCPACFKTFNQYKDLLPEFDVEVEFITTPILKYLEKSNVDYNRRERVTYHDPCHLGRHSGIYDEPREILKLLGYEVVEMHNSRNESLCCGGGAGLRTNNPELANKVAKKRIEQARVIGVDRIITTCPLCFTHLEENSDIKVEDFSYVVADALGLKPEKTNLKEEKKEVGEACS